MNNGGNRVAIWILTILVFLILMIFVLLAHTYAFEAWAQYHYRAESIGFSTPAFLALQRDLWWLWFLFPAGVLISGIAFFANRISARMQPVVLSSILLLFVCTLLAWINKTITIWLSAFGRIW